MQKAWYKSTTIQGQIVAAVSLVVSLFDLPLASDEVSTGVAAILALVGIGVSVYGRVKTKGEKLTK